MIKTVGFEKITVSDLSGENNRRLIGKTLSEAASMWGRDVFDTLFTLLTEEQGNVSMVISHLLPADVETIISHPDCIIASDSTSAVYGRPHPRFYGNNGRIFRYYVREKKLLSIEEAVRKMCSLPARTFGIAGRGELAVGKFADVLIFDPEEIADRATYNDPVQFSAGMRTVVVNGKVAFDNGAPTGTFAGRVLRKGLIQ